MADLDELLLKTSRTFALSIPELPEPTRREVTVAYLLFRIADTFEDATEWLVATQLEALARFEELLERRDAGRTEALAAGWTGAPPLAHDGYVELLANLPFVLDAYWSLGEEARRILATHLQRTSTGMAEFVARRQPGEPPGLGDLEELRAYCYVVAGIVGEMLTELFLLGRADLAPVAEQLRARARSFGEGLQLVNVLKDAATDLEEGRRFLPATASRAEIFELARRDLERAAEYVATLHATGADRGLVAFTALPILLARASLDRVERRGPGSKLTRPEVWLLVKKLDRALDRGASPFPEAVLTVRR